MSNAVKPDLTERIVPPGSVRAIRRPAGRPTLVVAASILGSWALPALFHLARLDWLSLLALFVGTASLVRAGVGLFDRLMLTVLLMMGEFITAGLLFSLWPWGLHPVAMAGTLGTLTIVVAVVTGRRPMLPRRVSFSDLIAPAAAAYAMYELYKPLAGKSLTARLRYIVMTEDKASHFSLFDAIHRVGGYTYFHADQASTSMDPEMARVYPPGTHFLYSVLDVFVRSTTDDGNALAAYNRYFLYTVLGYGFVVLALVWAARWVAGPTVTGWRRALVCAVVGTIAATGQLVTVFTYGHDSAALGVAVLAMTVAVAVRPAGKVREQVLTAAAGLVTLAFVYNLFVVLAATSVLAAAVVYWHRLRTALLFTSVAAVITGVIVLIPIVGPQLSGFSQTKQLQATGGIDPMSRNFVVACVAVVLLALLTRAGRRSPVWRTMAIQIVLAAAGVVLFGLYQVQTLGATSYYYEKAVQGLYAIGLVGLGAIGSLLRPGGLPVPAKPSLRPLARVLPSLAAVVAGVTLAGGLQFGAIVASDGVTGPDTTYAAAWADGRNVRPVGVTAKRLQSAGYLGKGPTTLFIISDSGTDNWRVSFLDAILKRRLGETIKTVFGVPWLKGLASYGEGSNDREDEVHRLEDVVRGSPQPLRLVISNAKLAARFEQFAMANPNLRLQVTYVPGID
ncbi:hypothetical protein B4N89_13060 [Embleya scabrispora]|uniref:Glycosyltransferase RgtA/B/C/D-like domain-containing protein n=1 Tax=Embleya scabrispora TaxID=159449 RepID=A0A1T3NYA8_9ACTN|nr:hypothetical protein [Embleya scabrispora]OPC81744.1 hypothetical protein B4N89_13060 [Embleya scabrispora]